MTLKASKLKRAKEERGEILHHLQMLYSRRWRAGIDGETGEVFSVEGETERLQRIDEKIAKLGEEQ